MKRSALPAVVIVAAAALVGLLVYGLVSRGDDRTIDDALAAGKSIPAPGSTLELPVLGKTGTRSIEDYRGKVVVLNFWASWCTPCRTETPALERVQKRIQRRGATVLGIDYKDTTADALAFGREYGVSYPNLRDPEGKLAREYGTAALPETFVIDRQGRIVASNRGAVDERFLNRTLEPLLQGSPS